MRRFPFSLFQREDNPTIRRDKPRRAALVERLEDRKLLSRGLIGYYFAGTDFTQVQYNRVDPAPDLQWESSPVKASDDGFGVRWSGRVLAKFSETYRFYTRTTGGVRMWVDDQLIIDDRTTHPIKDNKGEIALQAGVRHDIRVEYFDNQPDSYFQIHWASPRQEREVLPTNRLFPSDPDTTPPSTVFKLRPSYVTDTAMKVIWSPAVEDSGIVSYDVYIGKTKLGTTKETEFYRAGRQPETSYNVSVRSIDFAGNVTISEPVTVSTLPEFASGAGIGLAGMYYASTNFTKFAMTRTDAELSFGGNKLPFQTSAGDPISARWTGTVLPKYDEVYTFSLETNGGARMWVGGKLLIDQWNNQSAADFHNNIRLRAGQEYSIRVEYRRGAGNMALEAKWASFSTQPRTIDTTQLSPAFVDSSAPSAPGDLRAGSIGGSSISMNWDASVDDVGIVRYDVYRNGALVGSTPTTSYVDGGLSEDTQYTYTVRAVDGAARASNASSPLSARTESTIPWDARSVIPAVQFADGSGVSTSAGALTSLDDGDWVKYSPVAFGDDIRSLKIKLGVPASSAGGRIDIRLGSPNGQLIGSHSIQPTGSYTTRYWQNVNISGVSGQHDLYFVFNGSGGMASIEAFQFSTARLLRVMPLGDSITVSDPSRNSYRYYLYQKLIAEGYAVDFVGSQTRNGAGPPANMDFDQNHESYGGWRVDQVLDRIDSWLSNTNPDVVLIHLGTNDLWQGNTVASTVSEMGQLIDRIRAFNSSIKIVVAQVIPLNGYQTAIAEYNAGLADMIAGKQNLQSPLAVADMFTNFSLSSDAHDGVHPSTSGEIKIADWFYDALASLMA